MGFTSTLSDKYDTHNHDVSWVCVFCQQYTHMQCLGDLYGPYFINEVSGSFFNLGKHFENFFLIKFIIHG